MSKSHMFRHARVVCLNRGVNIGESPDIPGYELTVVNTVVGDRWMSMDARRGVFANVDSRCLSPNILAGMFSRTDFSYQLPCMTAGPLDTPKDSSSSSDRPFSQIVRQDLVHMASNIAREQWRRRVQLLPRGVRSTVAAAIALRELHDGMEKEKEKGADGKSKHRKHLLDCSCAKQYPWGQRLIDKHRKLPCSSHGQNHLAVSGSDGVDEKNSQQVASLVQYYKSLAEHSFVLTPSDPEHMSHCEWEALAFGAIPIVADYMRELPEVKTLYEGLPIYFPAGLNDVTEGSLKKRHTLLIEQFADTARYSLAKLFVPYWQGRWRRYGVQGKPPMRTWRGVGTAVSAMRVSNCKAIDGRAVSVEAPAAVVAGGSVYVPKAPRDSTGRVVNNKNLPVRLAHSNSGHAMGKGRPSSRMDRHRRLQGEESGAMGGYAGNSSSGGMGGRMGRVLAVDSAGDDVARRAGRAEEVLVEFVLPRCCEEGFTEFEWLEQAMRATTATSHSDGSSLHSTVASIYYKCAQCLPESKIEGWLRARDTPLLDQDYSSVPVITALDDSPLVALGADRVYQSMVIDRLHNGKEVTAYLTHIVQHYDSLARQTIFLHTAPHAHLHINLFFRLIAWAYQCVSNSTAEIEPVDFLHLNVHYKTAAPWASCCGCKIMGGPGSCRKGIWEHLFHDHPEMGGDYGLAHTYSSAQFAVSRKMIRKWPKSFYEKMLHAIDGTIPSPGCCNSSTPDPWGGHALTGQYERMWHMIFGQSRIQVRRSNDRSLPQFLRVDCGGHEMGCSVGAL
jgi:hypothetical protein